MTKHTGPYPKSKIDRVSIEQKARMKTFKNAKDIDTEWLTKRNSVNQTHQEFYMGKGAEGRRPY